MITVAIIGFGNVGKHLYEAFSTLESCEVVAVFSRNQERFQSHTEIPVIRELDKLPEAAVTIIAVADDAIAEVSDTLPERNGLVVHTSGNTPMEAIATKHRRGVFYPLQSFSKRTVSFKEIPICLEAEHEDDYEVLTSLASQLSDRVFNIDSTTRAQLHLAAVFANNFVNHLYHVSETLLSKHELNFSLLQPLIFETAQRLSEMPPSEAQTGPAIRGDEKTIKKQLHLLEGTVFQSLYQQLTESIAQTHGKKL